MKKWFVGNYGIVGIVMTAISFLHWLLPQSFFNAWTLFIIHMLFTVGLVMFFDWICFKLEGKSVLKSLKTQKDLILVVKNFIIIGVFFGLFIEIYAHWIGKFWFYTYWGWGWYLIMFVPGFVGYVFFFLETFLGVKAVLSKLIKKEIVFSPGNGINKLTAYISAGVVLIISIFTLYFQPYRNINDFFSIDFALLREPIFLPLIFLAAVPVLAILDYMLQKKRGFSFTSTLLKFNLWPIIALLLSGWIIGFFWEWFNAKAFYWTYANSIFSDLNMLGFPVSVFVLWPIQYIPIVALYYFLFDREK